MCCVLIYIYIYYLDFVDPFFLIIHFFLCLRILSGFSIWRVDNIIGTFCAHASMHCPTKDNGFDLHQILLRNPNWNIPHCKSNSDVSVENDRQSQQDGDQNSNSSGWDIIRSLSKTSNCYMSTPHFERVWWDKGCDSRPPISIWRPLPRPGFAALGDCVTEGWVECDSILAESIIFILVDSLDLHSLL